MDIAVKFWDKYHSCCIENGKFPIQHALVVFIPNFTATHAITSTNYTENLVPYQVMYELPTRICFFSFFCCENFTNRRIYTDII